MQTLPPSRAGVGYGLPDLYAWVGNAAGNGYNTSGQISELLLNSSLTVEAVRNMLQTVAANVGSNPQQLAIVTDELRYLNTGQSIRNEDSNKWLLPVLAVLAVWWVSSREK